MITLLQLINRMIYLEYSRAEVESHLDALAVGILTGQELFDILGLIPPQQPVIDRLIAILPKRESAVVLSFLRAEKE